MSVQGNLDKAVGQRLLATVGLECWGVFGLNGKEGLIERLPAYCRSARRDPWFILIDFDRDAPCAPTRIEQLVGTERPDLLALRIAVRAVESWLMADKDRFATFLGIKRSAIPDLPDEVQAPTEAVVNLARESKHRRIREALVPEPGRRKARRGPLYSQCLTSFVLPGTLASGSDSPRDLWDPEVAAGASPSLRSCLEALRGLRTRLERGR